MSVTATATVGALMLGYFYFAPDSRGSRNAPDELKLNGESRSVYPIFNTSFPPKQDSPTSYIARPRTEEEAIDANWIQLSSCDDRNIQFPGNRYAESSSANDIVVIFDDNGIVAGIQAVIDASIVDTAVYNFDGVPYSQAGDFLGTPVYYMTAWFVEPSRVCDGRGRRNRDLRRKGTIDALYLQSGPTPDNRLSVPLTNEAMDNDTVTGWNEMTCWAYMGKHYAIYDYDTNVDCSTLNPFTIIYNAGKLNGFVFNVLAPNVGPKWETVTTQGLVALFPPAFIPTCMIDITANKFTLSALHVYFDQPYTSGCDDAQFPLNF